MTAKTKKILLLVILTGMVVRMLHFAAISQSAFIEFPIHASEMDMYGYWQWSETIVEGDWLGQNTWHPQFEWMEDLANTATWHRWWGNPQIFQQEPVYPYLLAMGRFVGLSISGLILIQLIIGALQPLVTFLLTRLVFRHDGPALMSAVIAALFGPLIFNQGSMLRDWLAPLLGSFLLIALLRAHAGSREVNWFWPGLLFGIMLMTHSTILVFLLTLVPWLLWVNRDAAQKMTMRLGVFLAGGLAGFSPLLARNLYLGVPPLSISNRLPEGIVSGMAADSNPLGMTITSSLPGILEQAQGSAMIATVESMKTHGGDWAGFFQLMWQKLRGLIDSFEIPNNLSYAYGQEISPVLKFMPDFAWVFPAAVLGILLVLFARKFDHRQGLMLAFGGAMFIALMINLVLGRYRLAIMAVMFVYAGWAAWQLWQWTLTARYQKLAIGLAALLGLVFIQQIVLPVEALRQSTFFVLHPPSYHTSSNIYAGWGRPDLSVAEWKRMQARALLHGNEIAADAAVEQEQSVRLKWLFSAYELGRMDLVKFNLVEIERLFDLRRDQSMRDYAMGVTYFRMGRLEEAYVRLQKFIQEYPGLVEAEKAREVIQAIDAQ